MNVLEVKWECSWYFCFCNARDTSWNHCVDIAVFDFDIELKATNGVIVASNRIQLKSSRKTPTSIPMCSYGLLYV